MLNKYTKLLENIENNGRETLIISELGNKRVFNLDEIIEDKHAVTGEPVLRVRLTSTAERAKLKEFSLSPNQSFIVKTYGGKGGEDNSRFYNGGDGGDIIVYKDPSVSSFRIKYDTKGGAPGGSSASFGREGDYRVIEQALNFNH